MNEFIIGKNSFMLNGEPVRIISGAMHYFRVPREYWRDRLLKIKACGFNTVETYTAWNMHEPEEGKFDFAGNLDLKAYLELVNELGMFAIVRPGPYICSEWEFGGFPWWLLRYDDIELRCMNDTYLSKVDAYFDKLIPIISSCQIDNGGSVIMVQVENEYGSYGDDSEYIRYIASALRIRGITCELFTSDGDCDFMLTGGTVPEIFKTVNFGSKAEKAFANLRKFQPDGPLMCAEFWNGWFDHWGEKHHKRDISDAVKSFREVLAENGNISVYMMHGGTNFGFMNGANCTDKEFQPTVNSYDDDAPINEYGGLTEKYYQYKNVLSEYGFSSDIEVAEPVTVSYPSVSLNETAGLFDTLDIISEKKTTTTPLPMEKLGQGYGFICYETFIKGPREANDLHLEVHDRAYVYINNEFKGIQYRNDRKNRIKFSVPADGLKLTVLVENMGRINYGPYLKDNKGLVSTPRLGAQLLYHWDTYCLPFDNISDISFERKLKVKFRDKPVFMRGILNIEDEPCDTFVKPDGFKKGLIWVNGKLLSRYWDKGPQLTCYLPAPFLKKGANEIVVLELEGFKKPIVNFVKMPVLDK
ncbi:MAG: beta-galactosidase [Ruminococcaceae bacterium]|nr:beta-galactosidase [Oscillospiraceae bacterium]